MNTPTRRKGHTLALLLAAGLLALDLSSASAQAPSPRETLGAALAKVAGAARGSAGEIQAMEKAIAAARALPTPPTAPDAIVEHLGRAKTAARLAASPRDFLDAAEAFGEAARLAPWVAEHHFNRGLMLEKAERFDEATQALQLYLKAAPNARDAAEVRERIAGLRYLKEKAARAPAAGAAPSSAGAALPAGLYYNDGDHNTASTTTLMGHSIITAMRIEGGRITCGTLQPPNRNLSRPTGFSPYRDGQLEIANASAALDGTQLTFCDNVRWCPTGAETGYRTGLHVTVGKDARSLRVRANNCIAKPDYDVLTWHPPQ